MPNNNNLIPKENTPKTEEVRELTENLTEAEINQRIADNYNFELDSYSDISRPKAYGSMYRASAPNASERFTPFKNTLFGG